MRQKNEKTPKQRKPRPLFTGAGSRIRRLWSGLVSRVGNMASVKAIAETDGQPAEPIDLSAPSVPYYVNLAEKFNLARIVLYMVLFAFLAVTLISSRQLITYENLYYLVKDINAAGITAQSEANHLSYSVSTVSPSFALFRGGLVVAGGHEITVLSGSGKQTMSDNVSLSTPCVSAGGQYFVTFSRGDEDFSVYNAFVRVHHEVTEYPVYDACMGGDGSLAVLTRSRDYTSEVIWYNDKMNKLAACHLRGYVTSMAVSEDSRTLVVTSVELSNGALESKLTFLRRGGGGDVTYDALTVNGSALGAGFMADDRLWVIYDFGVCVYRVDGQTVSESQFLAEKPILWGSTAGYLAVLCEDETTLSRQAVRVYDRNGREVYAADIEGAEKYSSLVMDGQDVYLLGSGHILRVRGHGRDVDMASVDRNALSLLVDGEGRLLLLTPSYARYPDGDEFE